MPTPNHDRHVYDELLRRGRMTFAEFMETALYHPVGGYYTAHVELGPAGDFVTAPEEHPAFGALLARQAAQCWATMERPDVFQVVEMGGGRGTLAAAFLKHAHAALPDFATAVRYTLIDRSPRLTAQQQARLADFAGQVTWMPELPAEISGLLLSNELLDAFPVHRVVMRDGALHEIYVVVSEEGLDYEEGSPSTPALADYFTRQEITLAEGQQAEVNLAAEAWMRDAARAMRRGFVITIDFGHLAKRLYTAERASGTLLAYRRQRVSDDLLAAPGLQDLIAHVNFTPLVSVGKATGVAPLGLVTQRHFLLNLGLEGWLHALNDLPLMPEQRATNRRALLALIDPSEGGLGDAKVLVQAKGVTAQLDGLNTGARQRNAEALRHVSWGA